jgi:RNase H
MHSPGRRCLCTPNVAQARQRLGKAVQATIWRDGSCEPNPGLRDGVSSFSRAGKQIELYGGDLRGQTNAAELSAALLVVKCRPPQCNTTTFSDSRYLIFGMTRRIASVAANQSRTLIFGASSENSLHRVQFRGNGSEVILLIGAIGFSEQLAAFGRTLQPDDVAELMIPCELHQYRPVNRERGMEIPR